MSQSFTQPLTEGPSKALTEGPSKALMEAPTEAQQIQKKKGVRFGGEEVRYITPSPECYVTKCDNVGFDVLGFSSLGSVGDMETFNTGGSLDEVTSSNLKRRACAPISASRLVQRRWRSSNASGRR